MTIFFRVISTGLDLFVRVRDAVIVYHNLKDSWSKRADSLTAKVDCVAQVAFLAAQAADCKATYDCSSSRTTRIATKVALGATDVVQTTSHTILKNRKLTKDDVHKLVLITLFRAGMALSVRGDQKDVCEKNGNWVSDTGALLIAGAELLKKKDELVSLGSELLKIEDRLLSRLLDIVNSAIADQRQSVISFVERYRAREILRILNGENQSPVNAFQNEEEKRSFLEDMRTYSRERLLCPISGEFIRHPIHHKERPTLVVDKESLDQVRDNHLDHVVIGNERFPLESFEENAVPQEVLFQEEVYKQFRRIHVVDQEIAVGYKALLNPATLQTIPRIVWDEPSMHQFKCRITRTPIRFIVAPNADIAVCYEEKALRKWLEEKPHQLPPNWPQDIPFDSAHIQRDESGFQERLEMDLRDISEEIQAAGLGTAQSNPLG